ncbi:MAG: glucose-1-phosphate adenylyltransferase [Chloroflexi bacterium]|nr:glucose-1-phosphate adenylyltransferase [Chloroflexota bacterium]
MDHTLAIVMAGGAGERLQPLTRDRTKAAVPFGGKFRIIDFTLSNCINSGIRKIYILTQYRSGSLNQHIQEGWGISSSGLGDFIYCVPAQQKLGAEWYRGTADAVRQNIDLIRRHDAEYLLILSGDHIYKMDYSRMLAFHKMKGAEATISAIRVPRDEAARRFGVIEIDDNYRMIGFEEKPRQPRTVPGSPDQALASMGIYLFNLDVAIKALEGEEMDFGKDIIPRFTCEGCGVYVYDFQKENGIEDVVTEVKDGVRKRVLVQRTRDSGYWRDVGTVESYYDASMDLVGIDPVFNLYGQKWPFRTFQRPLPPSKFVLGGHAPESMVSDGCIISGATVWSSILSPGVIVERDALVERSIIFDDVIIEPGAHVRRAIIDKQSRIEAGAAIGHDLEADRRRGCAITDSGIVVVPKGSEISRSEPRLL